MLAHSPGSYPFLFGSVRLEELTAILLGGALELEITRHITREPTEGPQYLGLHQHSGIYNIHSEVGLWETTFQGHSVELESVLDAIVTNALYCQPGHTEGIFEPGLPNCMEDCTVRVER